MTIDETFNLIIELKKIQEEIPKIQATNLLNQEITAYNIMEAKVFLDKYWKNK